MWCWEFNVGPLQEQPVLLITEPFFQLPSSLLFVAGFLADPGALVQQDRLAPGLSLLSQLLDYRHIPPCLTVWDPNSGLHACAEYTALSALVGTPVH